ncbi:MAG: hypothetical protein F6K23_40270 [Okeania sp. SIO2C9]|uniref:hypothetical protein n=1 Tax=Okeania sp. SIO2C9 TaxID=2607791 RepID=UPI0013BFAE27|nr:hypothetical protein [Okeania sp. SIO2C9]NEQ78683.1 hypothetical protein [Okeania sp. SIO2C9]
MYSRDLELLVRQLKRQRCEIEYIRFYLEDTYQLDENTINQIFEKVGLTSAHDLNTGPSEAAKKQQDRANKFY